MGMSIPLVQGSLRYAYKVANLQGGSKEFAEGAAFSAAILPRVHACDASAAKVISENMNMEIAESARMSAGFGPVKSQYMNALESLVRQLGASSCKMQNTMKGRSHVARRPKDRATMPKVIIL